MMPTHIEHETCDEQPETGSSVMFPKTPKPQLLKLILFAITMNSVLFDKAPRVSKQLDDSLDTTAIDL